ncbi:MAG TPA: hypothetical protein VGK19_06955 [Capsulimonadaceae bacterium]|jgi:hypothetical protein
MKIHFIILIAFVSLALSATSPALAKPSDDAVKQLHALQEQLGKDVAYGTAHSLTVLYVEESILTFVAIKPEDIRKSCDFSLVITGDGVDSKSGAEFQKADAMEPRAAGGFDCRWGFQFRDVHGRVIHEIYMDRGGNGEFDSIPITIQPALRDKLRRTFINCFLCLGGRNIKAPQQAVLAP